MNNESIKKVLLPSLVFLFIIGIWSGIATAVEDFPTPSDTYVAAFGGVNADGDEIIGVLTDPFYIENQDDKGLFWQIIESLKGCLQDFL